MRDYSWHEWVYGVITLPTGSAYAVDSTPPTKKELRRIKRREPIGFSISTASVSAGGLADSKRLPDVVTQPEAKKKKKKKKKKR